MSKTTLVIGASLNERRYSNKAMKRLRQCDHPVKAIGLRKGKVAGVGISTEKKDFKAIDTVTLYINPNHQPAYYNYIIGLNPQRVIFNPGTENEEFHSLLKENGIHCEIACTLVMLSSDQY